jgi:hypothetical protein
MKNIYWNFVIGTVLLIVNSIVGVADFLQGGIVWPLLFVACGLQVLVLVMGQIDRRA